MDSSLSLILGLWVGLLLDLWLADPYWLPHPIVGFGKLIDWGERRLNRGRFRLIAGAFFSIGLITLVFAVVFLLELWLISLHFGLAVGLNAVCVFFGIANEGLIREGKAVFEALSKKGLEAGRKQLSRIVGRETSQLDAQQIRTATLESMSENLSDGVIAPLFYFALLGVPGIMAYKMANTLDSMIGYRNHRYERFGKTAAYVDDILNYIPARLTVLLMAVASLNLNAITYVIKYGHHHKSPNAGFPEAALAGILQCRFGGPNWYHGELVEKPYIGQTDRTIHEDDLRKTIWINHLATLLFCLIISIGWLIF